MKITINLNDKKVVYDDIDSLFIPFDNEPVLVHKEGETFPFTDKKNIISIKVESTKLKKEEKDANTSKSKVSL